MLTVIRADENMTHVALLGRLDIQGVNSIHDQFVFNTTTRRKATLVDLSNVTFIASLGMGMLVGAAKALQREGLRMVLVGPRDLVQRALEAAGIHHVIPIVPAEEDALRLLR
jgi:anti-sigma B factor antagonist